MRRMAAKALLQAGVVALTLLSAAMLATTANAAPPTSPFGTFHGCPSRLVPLPAPAARYAAAARGSAIRFLYTSYAAMNRSHRWGLKLAGAKTTSVLPTRRWLASGWIKQECGLRVWQRSVAVTIRLPAMEYPNPKGPCNSCAGLTLLLGKTARGWSVWGQF